LEERGSPLDTVDRVLRIDPQDLGCLSARLVELPQLRESRSQPDVAQPKIRGPRRTFAHRRQRLRILFRKIPGQPSSTTSSVRGPRHEGVLNARLPVFAGRTIVATVVTIAEW